MYNLHHTRSPKWHSSSPDINGHNDVNNIQLQSAHTSDSKKNNDKKPQIKLSNICVTSVYIVQQLLHPSSFSDSLSACIHETQGLNHRSISLRTLCHIQRLPSSPPRTHRLAFSIRCSSLCAYNTAKSFDTKFGVRVQPHMVSSAPVSVIIQPQDHGKSSE